LDRCAYCSFRSDAPEILDLEECDRIGKAAIGEGAVEALIMTGEGIDRHKILRDKLAEWGFDSYAAYTAEICRRYLELGLLPHANIGTLEEWELEILKPYNISMGMMVETVSPEATRIAHRAAPTKTPERRLASLEAAGRLGIPFTTGILIGIGERPEERIETLEAIAEIHSRYGHIQEVIIQPLNPQAGTPMANWPRPGDEEIAVLIPEVHRLMPGAHVQIPPNLVDDLPALLHEGADDLGGIAHEPDFINPNRAWPELASLHEKLRPHQMTLRLRMPVYDEFIEGGWCPEPTLPALQRQLALRAQKEAHLVEVP
jgi:7,8-didemethyl-8-hydroxy-5-deazariboflavin synthase CofG subunit